MIDLGAKLAEILEVTSVEKDDVLANFENWDSLTALSVLAMLDAEYGINLTARQLREVHTVAELEAAVSALVSDRNV